MTHPLQMGHSDSPLRGLWVRHKETGYTGYISHVERNRDERPILWIVYPPGRLPSGTRIKTWSAGSAYADEVKKLRREKVELEEIW